MTDLPPSETPETQTEEQGTEPPAERRKAKKRKRTLLRTIAVFSGIGIGALVGVGIVALVGGRYYLVSDAGRELISGFVQGKKIGRYGAINVEGLKGDLFDDFTLSRVTVTDKDGVWLEARDVRVDWNYWSLLVRRFHADEITAKSIHLIRQPALEPQLEPGGPQALSIDIDKISADVELMEDFSKEYGKWRLAGAISMPRTGDKDFKVDALSLSRPGDFLKVHAVLSDKIEDIRLNLQAQEAQGGPLAGSLGYSPDKPFSATGLIDGRNVNLVMTTGDYTPLRVHGQFSKQNSFMSGYANFAGSEVMKPLADRFGPTARIGLAAAPDSKREGYQGMAWKLVADNITTTASGYVRVKDGMFADNVKLVVRTPSLSRLAGTRIADAASYEGVFRGDASAFDLNGQADVANAEIAGYRVTRLTGPLAVSAKDQAYTLKGNIAAAGASPNGLIGGLLGRSPRVAFEASRLKDGNILLKDIDLKGSALTLKGSGRRNLLGGLSFNADFDINNIGVLKQGATGHLGGKLRGNMARNGAPWTLNFDGGGRNLALGIAEVDRLLGKSPKLVLNGVLNRGVFSLTEGSRLNGAKANVTATGPVIGSDMALDLKWDATGPFGFGPVIIDADRARTVKISGTGTIKGKLNTPQIRFLADIPRAAIGKLIMHDVGMALTFNVGDTNSHGNIAINGTSNTRPAQQANAQADFRFGKDLITLSNLDVNAGGITAQGHITLSQMVPTLADLTITGRPGAFIQRGSLNGRIQIPANAGPNSANINVNARDLIFRGTSMHFSTISVVGNGNLDRLKLDTRFAMTGENPISYNGDLIYSRLSNGHRLEANGNAVIRGIAARIKPETFVQQVGSTRSARVLADIGQGTADFNWKPLGSDQWDATLDVRNVSLGALNKDLQGTFSGEANLRNNGGQRLLGGADFEFRNAGSASATGDQRAALVNGQLDARLIGDILSIRSCANFANAGSCEPPQSRADVRSSRNLLANIYLDLPMINQAKPAKLVTDTNRNVDGHILINGDVGPLFNLVDGVDRRLAGQMDADIQLGGRVQALTVEGKVFLTDATFDEASTGLRLSKLNMDAAFNRYGVVLSRLDAKDRGNGTVCGQGSLLFGTGGSLPSPPNGSQRRPVAAPPEVCNDISSRGTAGSLGALNLRLANFELVKNDTATILASGRVDAVRNAQSIELRGNLDIDKATIEPNLPGSNGIVRAPVTDRNAPPRAPVRSSRSRTTPLLSTPINLNVRLNADDIVIKGRGLDLQMATNAVVRGTIANPQLTGTARVVRGDYDFAGKRFTFDDDGQITLSTDPSRIRLNLTATREDPTLTAIIKVSGTAAAPRIALSSDPVLPQDEILARVLFGRSVSQLSAIEAAQLASGVASLAGGGGLDVIGGIRDLAGLDRLSFGGEASNLTIAGGRRIGNNLYLEIIGGGEDGATIRVEWQVRKNIAVTSSFSGNNTSNVSVRWRRERD